MNPIRIIINSIKNDNSTILNLFAFFEIRDYIHLVNVNQELYTIIKQNFRILLDNLNLHTKFTKIQFDIFIWLLRREYKCGISKEIFMTKYLGENSIISKSIIEIRNIFKECILLRKYRTVCNMTLPIITDAYNYCMNNCIVNNIRIININFAIRIKLISDSLKTSIRKTVSIAIDAEIITVYIPRDKKYKQNIKSL